MNQLKERLQKKLDHLRRGEVLYYKTEDSSDVYAFCFLKNSSAQNLTTLMTYGGPLSLLVSDQSEICKSREKIADCTVLACDFSAQGLMTLASNPKQEGPDRILLRVVESHDILKNLSVEGRIVEFASNVEGEEHCLIYTKIYNSINVDSSLLLNEEDISLARFFNPRLIDMTGMTEVELQQGTFKLYSFYSEIDGRYHWAFVCNDRKKENETPLVRIESECLTGHVFGSLLCDCGDQLSKGLEEIKAYGYGALVYLRQEGRGIGLKAKLDAYYFQQFHDMDTVDANLAVGMPEDARDYLIGAQILNYLKFEPLKLLTNNPAKISGLNRYGLSVEQQVSHIIPPSKHNKRYLDTKRDRMGHRI
ncbi:GTP cyclohydrolase II [Lentisphaera profundi]|uniref:GTP cyclohydrolase II n=1 Tax=Lentisphaera profundi TaxID=1658616 RepID=A0ABY7VS26_9BACT|nr:GTP cyclohydrolase II [Lentisphaera profundi]WDE97008.1 GTP cyclohydrolase II [Lentisphaera profundi]